MSTATHEAGERAPATSAADKAEAILEHLISAKGGKRRDGQVEMARHVATALSKGSPEMIQGGTGIGKALDVDTLIPTVEGWVRMGDLEAGVHHPFDEHGNPCNITEAFVVRKHRKCYELSFFGGGKIVADAEHLWDTVADSAVTRQTTDDPWEGAKTRTTEEIAATLRRRNRPNHRIPMAKPIKMKKARLPIDPYELGFWLGGSERRSPDVALVTPAVVPEESLTHFEVERRGAEAAIIPNEKTARALKKLGLLTSDRSIPDMYMFASEEQRRSLFTGLMDAMGQPRKTQRQMIAQVTAYKTQVELVEDVHALACSLGVRASMNTREFRNGSYQQVFFTPDQQVFRAPSKMALAGNFEDPGRRLVGSRSIIDVTEVKSRPVRCISVDSPSRLYLAGRDFIPTHNSLAYLAGALASGQRAAVAPHTKALQDQLGTDLDLVAEAFQDADFEDESVPLDHAPTYAIIKGRSSYYCGNKLAAGRAEEDTLDIEGVAKDQDYSPSSDIGAEVAALAKWAATTETGDRSDAPSVSHKAWQMVAGSADDCSANGCKKDPDLCFAQRAHEAAKLADIVVVNQAYLAAAMKIEFLGIADCNAVIVDEAHELPMVVAEAFGAVLKRKRVEQTLKRCTNILVADELIDEKTAEQWTKECEHHFAELERHLSKMSKFGADREIVDTPGVKQALKDLINLFDPIRRKVRAATERAADETAKASRQSLLQTVENLVDDIMVIAGGSDDFQVSWADKERGEPVLHSARFDVSETIHEHLIDRMTAGRLVMTSATLTVGGTFEYPAQQMGFTLDDTYPWSGHVVTSPFNYKEQGMLWLPEGMPAPVNTKEGKIEYAEAVAEVAVGVARAAGGRTLVLCTSKQSVEIVSQRMAEELEPEGIPVLVQQPGEPPRHLAKQFGDNPKAVLVGTRTFWTGVSVEGDTCVAVVVDKIPFPTPSDPIIAARTEKVDRQEGRGRGFAKVSLSEAILTIVQGVGRLIRTVNDRGVVVLCDPRVNPRTEHKKGYWRNIASSLPDFSRTVSEEKVYEFLREVNRTANDARPHEVEVEEVAEGVDEAVEDAIAV